MTSDALNEIARRPQKPRGGQAQFLFDPSPLIRQLALTLPDERQSPLRVREQGTLSAYCGSGWDGGRTVVRDRQIADALGVNLRRVQRLKHGARLTREDADHFAVRCGWHPANLWPNWYSE